ncbi:microsomal signal peptidase 12kDa subunit [Sodiomyces alkalinus F11]|uniref:Signal peptidase complex subunit 1 n=1 Tax=Sodiomyces alkalinus (strain CBS 110278 / VKM F-3762 / F11) TaxID=1314773 RepID=A0A3N2PWF0_SODAK|nr:microsomal signal peptidase 12kDa subunit [Sodiomyces alkalinus F11]ROT38830.1 microsomal signal peptidase 12kDa subunit [Sodiomyces alkalinus F11]
MAQDALDKLRDLADGQIDFEGQKLAELLSTLLLSVFAVLSFMVGFTLQDIKLAVYIGLVGTCLTFLVVVPPWPFFTRHPIKWLDAYASRSLVAIETTTE